jgi:hypothetical protein
VLLLSLGLSQTEASSRADTKEDLHQKAKVIYDAIEKLQSESIPEQQEAFEKLLSMGPEVLPFISAYLKEKAIFLELVRQIIHKDIHSNVSQTFTGSLHNIGKLSSEATFIEKYLYGKYLQALRLFEQENYDLARELSNAILIIEKNLSFKPQIQLLKIQCEEMLIQKELLKTTLTATAQNLLPPNLYEIGENIHLTLRLENVTLVPLEILFQENDVIYLDVQYNQYDPFGNFTSQKWVEEVPIKINSLKLAPSEKKEWTFVLETKRDDPKSLSYRTYNLHTKIRPGTLKSEALKKKIGMRETFRKIVSPSITLKCFPPDVEPVLKNPLERLETALKGGIPLDIFLCALLVPEKEQARAIELLIKTLEQPLTAYPDGIEISPEIQETVIITSLKHITNLPFDVDKKTWLDWFKYKKK